MHGRPSRARPAPRMNPPSPKRQASTAAGSNPHTSFVVLAAGLGTRMKSALPKVLHPLCGRPMLAYVLDAWDEAAAADVEAPRRPVVVYPPPVAAVRDQFADRAN